MSPATRVFVIAALAAAAGGALTYLLLGHKGVGGD